MRSIRAGRYGLGDNASSGSGELRFMTIGELESAWRSIKDRMLAERDWVASSRLGQAARDIETAIGEALVTSGLVNDSVDATAQAASDVLSSGGSVSEAVAAQRGENQNAVAVTSTAGAAADNQNIVQQAVAGAQEAANLGVNVLAGGALGMGAGYLLGSKHPMALGLIGAVGGALLRPLRRS